MNLIAARLAFASLLVWLPVRLSAQEGAAPAAHGGDGRAAAGQSRVQRGREFLGLGPPADPEAAKRGQELFVRNCGFCHGANANGAEGPNLVRSTVVLHDEKGETVGPVILNGRPDRGMPAFASFTQAQIFDISQFLHSRVEAAANRYTYKMLNIVTGDAAAGEAYFNGAGRCNTCHSATGDLAHIASKFQASALQSQFLYPANPAPGSPGEKRVNTPPVKVTLKSGETISGRLKRIDDFEVSLYDSAGNYRAFPVSEVKVEVDDPLAAHRELLAKYTDADMHNLLAYLVTLK